MSEELKRIVANRVRYFRKSKKLTHAKLAELSNLSVQMVAAIEGSDTGVSLESLASLAKALEVDPADLLLHGVGSPSKIEAKILNAISEMQKMTPDDLDVVLHVVNRFAASKRGSN